MKPLKNWLITRPYPGPCIAAILIALMYIFSISISLEYKNTQRKVNGTEYSYMVNSISGRDTFLNIVSGAKVQGYRVNGVESGVYFDYPKTRVSHQDAIFGDEYVLPLKRGKNIVTVLLENTGRDPGLRLAQKYQFTDFIVIAILLALPAMYLLVHIFMFVLDRILALPKMSLNYALVLLALGIVIRIWYGLDMGFIHYQHDYQGHIEYIEFIAHEFFVPLPHKAWEFPQQPVYYLFNGALFAVLEHFSVVKDSILKVISFFAVIISSVGLIYAYRLVRLMSKDKWVHVYLVGFLCFTPSLVYMSSRISNDPWASTFAFMSLFYLVSSYKKSWSKHLYKAIFFTSLLFLTKISGMVIEALFITLLLTSYIEKESSAQRAIKVYSMVGVVVLGYTLFRSFYPVPMSFSVVNSGIWPGQDLRPIGLDYIFSFNFPTLLADAEANILGTENHAVTRSFPTYQYATMLFGEFGYDWWKNQSYWLYFNMQAMILLGLIIPISWIAFFFIKKERLDIYFIIAVGAAFLLQLKFIFSYPSVSNTDFRYHIAVFFPLAWMFSRGCAYLADKHRTLKLAINIGFLSYIAMSCLFFITLIRLS